MVDLQVKLKAENCAVAEVKAVSDKHVILVVEATDKWDAAGLLKLSATLRGIAAILTAGLLLLFAFGADAEDMADWYKWVNFDAAEAVDELP